MSKVKRENLRKKVTLRDVAAVAEVSLSTASKAMNGRTGEVNAATSQRVLEAADRLGFTPNALAQAILSGHSGTVGLLTDDLEGRFSLPILMGAEDAFGAGKMSVLLCDARGDAIREQHHLKALVSRNVDGLIVVGSRPDHRASISDQVTVPVVYAYAPSADSGDISVVADNYRAGAVATEHLRTLGRQRIAHITGDPTYTAAQDRARGISDELAKEGLEMVRPPRFGSWSEAWGRAATKSLLQSGIEVDAIIGGSDQISRGIADTVQESGLRVPGDVAIASFDNWKAIAEGGQTPLTSIDLGFKAIGTLAGRLLSAAIRDDVPEERLHFVQPQLVVRESTVGSH